MENQVIDTLERIVLLATTALTQARKEEEQRRQNFKLIKFEDIQPMKKNNDLPKNIRRFNKDLYQGRKMVKGNNVVVYGSTPEECAEKLDKAVELAKTKAAYIKPKPIFNDNLTFGEYLYKWLSIYKTKVDKLAPNSIYQLELCIRKHTPEYLKQKRLTEIKAFEIDVAIAEIPSSRMREYTFKTLREALHKAYILELIPKDLAVFIQDVQHDRNEGKALTHEEQEKFLEIISGDPMEYIFRFYLLTGVRRSEALAIKWEHINFEKRTMFVSGTKNKFSKRTMPLSSAAIALIKSIPKNDRNPEYLFSYTGNYVNKKMRELFPTHTPKDLRHTFATRCFESGIPPQIYKLWMGHSKKSKIAETIYTHYEFLHYREIDKFTLDPNVDDVQLNQDFDPETP